MSERMASGRKSAAGIDDKLKEIMKQCSLCPRACLADRSYSSSGKKGYCGEADHVRVARASLHMWEEPCISGKRGSGTVFFTGCSLKCVFCQNRHIALGNKGRQLTVEQLAELFLLLQDKKAENINLVTPTHFVPQIVQALIMAKDRGLTIPIVYNTGSYETVETLKMLEGLIDIFLPDMKYKSNEIAKKYSNAPDYFACASKAIVEMVRQAGSPLFAGNLMKRGVIVRHMVMPGNTKDSKAVIQYLHETYGDKIYISILNQYTPQENLKNFPQLQRRVTQREYEKVIDYAISIGVTHAYMQEGNTAEESFIPDFDDQVYLNEIKLS